MMNRRENKLNTKSKSTNVPGEVQNTAKRAPTQLPRVASLSKSNIDQNKNQINNDNQIQPKGMVKSTHRFLMDKKKNGKNYNSENSNISSNSSLLNSVGNSVHDGMSLNQHYDMSPNDDYDKGIDNQREEFSPYYQTVNFGTTPLSEKFHQLNSFNYSDPRNGDIVTTERPCFGSPFIDPDNYSEQKYYMNDQIRDPSMPYYEGLIKNDFKPRIYDEKLHGIGGRLQKMTSKIDMFLPGTTVKFHDMREPLDFLKFNLPEHNIQNKSITERLRDINSVDDCLNVTKSCFEFDQFCKNSREPSQQTKKISERKLQPPGSWRWTEDGKLKLGCEKPMIHVPVLQEVRRRDHIVEIPQLMIFDALKERVYNQEVKHDIPSMNIQINEKGLEFPKIRCIEKVYAIPIITGFTHKFVEKWDIRKVPRPVVKYVGEQKTVEVEIPKIQYVDRIVEKETVVDTIQKKVKKITVVPDYFEEVKYVWKPVEKTVYVHKHIPKFDVNIECPAPLIVPFTVQKITDIPAYAMTQKINEEIIGDREITIKSPEGTIKVPEGYLKQYFKKEATDINGSDGSVKENFRFIDKIMRIFKYKNEVEADNGTDGNLEDTVQPSKFNEDDEKKEFSEGYYIDNFHMNQIDENYGLGNNIIEEQISVN